MQQLSFREWKLGIDAQQLCICACCFLVTISSGEHIATTKPRPSQIGTQRQGFVIGGKRGVVLPELEKRIATTMPCLNQIGRDRECLVISVKRCLVAPKFQKYMAASKPCLSQAGLD